MNKVLLSLNFMHCMERFATQIYRTQKPTFDNPVAQQQVFKVLFTITRIIGGLPSSPSNLLAMNMLKRNSPHQVKTTMRIVLSVHSNHYRQNAQYNDLETILKLHIKNAHIHLDDKY
jgi:hypothetical protein